MIQINMEMPKKCSECPLFVKSDSPSKPFVTCKILGKLGSVFNFMDSKPVDCPLKEVT